MRYIESSRLKRRKQRSECLTEQRVRQCWRRLKRRYEVAGHGYFLELPSYDEIYDRLLEYELHDAVTHGGDPAKSYLTIEPLWDGELPADEIPF